MRYKIENENAKAELEYNNRIYPIDDTLAGYKKFSDVMQKADAGPEDILTAGLDTIGVRIPKNNISLRILENVSYPLATTSANISGDSAGIKISDFLKEFDGVVDAIIDGGETDLKVASTIVRVESDNKLKIIREGTLKIKEM